MANNAREGTVATDWYGLGVGIGAMELGCDAVSVIASENVALLEQLGKVSRELETFKRMAKQHAIDSGAGEGLSTRAAVDNGNQFARRDPLATLRRLGWTDRRA